MNRIRTLFLAVALLCGLFLFTAAPEANAGPNPVVIMETSMGRIIVMLYPKNAPKTVENFLKYVDAGFYDNTAFHRVVQTKAYKGALGKGGNGMNIVQGGGFTASMVKKQQLFPSIVNEASTGLTNKKGTIAMARTAAPNSASSEFFFNAEDNPAFDYKSSYSQTGAGSFNAQTKHGYCAFGKVIRGMDVVEQILQVKTGRRSRMENVPLQSVFLKKAYRAK